MNKVKPFLRWAGGKTWLTNQIHSFIPKKINNYFEPFLGGAAMFFFLRSNGIIINDCFLSDANEELINTYNVLKNNPTELIDILRQHNNTEADYYNIRNTVYETEIERASRFIFLNRTSFNGIYRVNRQGHYNVPYGHRNLSKLYDFDQLKNISLSFDRCNFIVKDFKEIAVDVKENDLVFLDPPYTVAHENNGFIQYNQSLFSWENQIELSKTLINIKNNKGNFIMTNASHSSIETLYNSIGKKNLVSRSSTIGGTGARRTRYNELIYTNF